MEIYAYAPDYAAVRARLESICIPRGEGEQGNAVEMEGLVFKLKGQAAAPKPKPSSAGGALYSVSMLGSLSARAQTADTEGAPASPAAQGGIYTPKALVMDVTTVKLINIPRELTRHDVKDLATEKGLRVMTCNLVQDKRTLDSRGMAFISFPTREEAEKAIALLDGHRIDTNILSAEIAKR